MKYNDDTYVNPFEELQKILKHIEHDLENNYDNLDLNEFHSSLRDAEWFLESVFDRTGHLEDMYVALNKWYK